MKLMSRKEVAQMIGVGLVSLWRWESAGNFPARIKIGGRRVAWRESDILAWIESRPNVAGGQK